MESRPAGTSTLASNVNGPARRRFSQRLRFPGGKGRLAAALALAVAVLAVAAIILLSVKAPAASDPVQYPVVTGTLGEHLDQLQKSVEP